MTNPAKPKSVLVYLVNGVQGRAAVRAALARGFSVRALARDRAKAACLAAEGAELALGDLDDAASLRDASTDVDHAIVQIPIGPMQRMRIQAGNALLAARAGGLRSVILRLPSVSRPAPCDEPSFVANAMLKEMVAGSGLRWAVVHPTMYLENLLKRAALADLAECGAFRPPIAASQPIAWTCVDDCARAAVMLLEKGAYGSDCRVAGPESVTGDELMARISAALGRPLRYEAQAIDDFEHEVDRAMGSGVGSAVASKFRFFANHPAEAAAILADPFVPKPGLEGFRPTSIEDWCRRHRQTLLAALG